MIKADDKKYDKYEVSKVLITALVMLLALSVYSVSILTHYIQCVSYFSVIVNVNFEEDASNGKAAKKMFEIQMRARAGMFTITTQFV